MSARSHRCQAVVNYQRPIHSGDLATVATNECRDWRVEGKRYFSSLLSTNHSRNRIGQAPSADLDSGR